MKQTYKEPFDKYKYYLQAVQSPAEDVLFLEQAYWDIRQKKATIMREDFCAAFSLCCEWIKRAPENQAFGIDLDPEPLEYGRNHYLSQLPPEAQKRLELLQDNVMAEDLPGADIICALNFSYMGFKKRSELLNYFQQCYKSLPPDGIFVLDCFGGPSTHEANEHETEHDDFSYFWDQDSYNPLTCEAQFYIHFKRKAEKKREKIFSYDWRLWSIAELKDLFDEAGFKRSYVYWEGTDEDGDGDGQFTRTEQGEECESWVAYVVAEK